LFGSNFGLGAAGDGDGDDGSSVAAVGGRRGGRSCWAAGAVGP